MGNASKTWKLRDAFSSWTSPSESQRLTAKREIRRKGDPIDWRRIFFAAATAAVLATAFLVAFR